MIRALTIRFVACLIPACLLVVALNLLNASPGLALCSFFASMGVMIWAIGSYIFAHEDEIPTRSQHRQHRYR